MAYKIIAEKCIQCDACRLECPRNAITNADSESTYVIDQEKWFWYSKIDPPDRDLW